MAVAALSFACTAAAQGSAGDKEWSIELDCAPCHGAEAASLIPDETAGVAPEPEGTASPQAAGKEARGETDKETRESETGAKEGKEGTTGSFVALRSAEHAFSCTACHEDSPKLAAAHKRLNSGKKATRLKKTAVSDELCTSCHSPQGLAEATGSSNALVDSEGTTVNPHQLPTGEDHAGISCMGCHEVHASGGVEGHARELCRTCHHAGVYACGTCH